jgi:lipid A 3-O-deacylase
LSLRAFYDSFAAIRLSLLMQNSYCNIFLLCAVLVLLATAGEAQKTVSTFSQQFLVTSENDRYVFKGKDGYYTNGLLFNYTRALQLKNGQKRLNSFELGQKIFMPYSRRIYVPSQIDRPVTGYLYARFTRTHFKTPDALWQWGLSADAIGDASLARGVQNTFHNWIGVNSSWWGWVWDYQLKSQIGLNLHGTYAKGMISSDASSTVQLMPVTKTTLGTSFTNISQGLVVQVGQLRPLSESAFWNAAVQPNGEARQEKPEWAFYYYPELLFQAYNATVQGGLFRKNKGPVTSSPEPFVLTHQVGALFSHNRYLVQLAANFRGREARSQRFSQSYGSVQVGYRIN